MDIKLTPVERLILRNQYLILKQLQDEGEDYGKLIAIVENGFESEYHHLASSLYDEIVAKEDATEVIDILEMYWALQVSQKRLTDKIDGAIVFPGFDGNDGREGRYMGYARFLVRDGRFAQLKKAAEDFNSHSPRLEQYRGMLKRWKALKSGDEPGQRYNMSAEQIRQVLRGEG